MAITGSPNVIVQEQDLSSWVSSDSVTTAAMVGDFEWGPVNDIITVTNESKLIQNFGYPVDRNYKDWFVAANYLNYSSSLQLVRVIGEGSYNACDIAVTIPFTVNNYSEYTFQTTEIRESGASIVAKYPGEKGNTIRVAILNKKGHESQQLVLEQAEKEYNEAVATALETYEAAYAAATTPTERTEAYNNYRKDLADAQEARDNVTQNGVYPYINKIMSEDDFAVAVWMDNELKEYGIFSTLEGSTDVTGYENYVFKYFTNNSNYVYLVKENFNLKDEINIDVVLQGGTTTQPTLGNYMTAWDLFRGAEIENVDLLLQGGASTIIGQYIIDLAESRADCVACVSPELAECVNVTDPVAAITNGSATMYSNSSYAFMDGNYKYQYDKYNDVYRWVPLNGDMAGIMAATDADEYPWMSPGNKHVKNVVKLAFYPDKAERDILFSYNVNPVTSFKEEGVVLYGDWTRVNNTAFNFVGVRRCFLYMERNIKQYARTIMFKQNDEITETTFRQTVEPFLTLIQGGRGISEFKLFTGEDVLSDDERDRGIFKAKIYVKPIRSIRYVVLVFTAVRSDIDINEVAE